MAAAARYDDPVQAVRAARAALRRRELFRIAAARRPRRSVGRRRRQRADRRRRGDYRRRAWRRPSRQVAAGRRGAAADADAVIGMGRYGGGEIGYGSDADVVFVHDPLPGADERDGSRGRHAVANEVRPLLRAPSPDPPLEVDTDLRPEGKQGPLVRTVASYLAYYDRWRSSGRPRRCCAPSRSQGTPSLGQRFPSAIDPIRWPDGRRRPTPAARDPPPQGAHGGRAAAARRRPDAAHQARVAAGSPTSSGWSSCCSCSTPPRSRAAHHPDAGRAADGGSCRPAVRGRCERSRDAWRVAARIRNAVLLVRGRPGDSIPTDVRERASVARLLGYPPGESGMVVEDYRRVTRRARSVVERVFYG